MIEFRNVSFSFPGIPVLDGVNFKMEDGQFVGILGPNGGGKSTFLRLVLGLLKPNSGEVVNLFSPISYVSQTTSLSDSSFPANVYEAVSLGLLGYKGRLGRAQRKAKIDAALEEFGLSELRGRLVNELSGGQLQRVKLAKAIVGDPTLLVLDEPDAGMDEESHHALIECLHRLHHGGMSILFVSHHPHDLEEADAVYFIEDGHILTYEQELERGHRHVDL
ncbi:MAG: metal ABC transporter ATP-binding protein [Bacillota bacterium]|nr:metal ABC transporter ATP-binding protein [Bacillota bacterium]